MINIPAQRNHIKKVWSFKSSPLADFSLIVLGKAYHLWIVVGRVYPLGPARFPSTTTATAMIHTFRAVVKIS